MAIYYRQMILNASRLVGKHIKLNNNLRTNIPIFTYSFPIKNFKYLYESRNRSYNNNNKNVNITHYYFLLNSLFFGFFKLNEEDEEISELIITIKRSILSMQRNEFKKAEQMLHIALRQAQALQNQNAITYIYDLMANVAFETKQLKKAETLFLLVLERLLSNGVTQDDLKVIHISLKLANIYEQIGDIEKAETGYKFCLKNLQIHVDNNPEDENILILLAMTYDWYAQLLFSQGKYTNAREYFEQSYNLCIKVNGTEHEQTVNLLNYLGTVSCKMEEYDKAIEYLTTAIQIGKSLPDMVHLGSVHINLGDVYLKKGLYSEAKKACNEGRKIAKNREDEKSLVEANKCLDDIKKLM
ncbi:tetratricopeptide repeat protein 19 homolog, mitochondrial-like [Vespa mandarinia]|uniref:tetratricopeptide repeat protein 19 homolog, mitochondrial-like n=1 Tax=Vespa mandarinia TaxID=7446 RepID=UPI00161F7848|nr:tetratricopeptide repeat protein 19 homolog, mitochondrial-like [Vespa mandarinia]